VRTKKELLAGEWAVLALLCERPTHGYAIAAAMAPDGDIGTIWSLGQPLTYRALSVLQQLELIELSAVKPGDRAPSKRELKATTRARRMVRRWLETPDPHVRDLRSGLLLKLHFLHRTGRSALPLLSAQHELLTATTAALEERVQETTDESEALVVRWRLTMAAAALQFVEEALEREQQTAAV
jgi:PadR family transcriptional regulator AphA